MNKIAGYTLDQWRERLPLLDSVMRAEEVFWTNPGLATVQGRNISDILSAADIDDAERRLERFAPYLEKAFPETGATGGILESSLTEIPAMKKTIEDLGRGHGHAEAPGRLYLKCDSHLPISGSVKARGGIYEVLKVAEEVALKRGLLSESDNYAAFDSEAFKSLLSGYSVVVGSTGNLGLSIGIMSARLGFKVSVHMSADAKQWKKDLLRAKGATVIEHAGDYGLAVETGRKESALDPQSHFVDDENSSTLFLGYAVAAKRLQKQLRDQAIQVDADHPLFVYIPCGVGGAPGGITFGLRTVFGDHVHCFFAEPTHSPAMLLGLMTGRHNEVSANDFGLDNITDADGLAVGRPSGFVGKTLEKDISGVFTIADERLYRLLKLLADSENIFLEPSALAGLVGPWRLISTAAGQKYIQKHRLTDSLPQAAHIAWATGGGMVPPDIRREFYEKGQSLLAGF